MTRSPERLRRQREQHIGQGGDDQRGLELEAPADLGPSRAQGEQRARERREADQHAGGVGEPVSAHGAGRDLGVADEGESLYGKDR